jgi:endo-1,4-beta-D-glucanase Y
MRTPRCAHPGSMRTQHNLPWVLIASSLLCAACQAGAASRQSGTTHEDPAQEDGTSDGAADDGEDATDGDAVGDGDGDGDADSDDGSDAEDDGDDGTVHTGDGQLFGTHTFKYPEGTILPTGDQAALDQVATDYYDLWKAAYLKTACGGYYVSSDGGTGTGGTDTITVSEAHGYGMVIVAMMAGHEPMAHEIFDGLNKLFLAYPSSLTPHLMAWAIGADCTPVAGPDSATDGDLDIAFALLLAARLWPEGSLDGTVKYDQEAREVINAVMAGDVNPATHLTMLGDWAAVYADEAEKKDSTRPSDFMLDHFDAFRSVDTSWQSVIDSTYGLIDTMQVQFAPHTGLLPDFVVNTSTMPKPAMAGFLEDDTDGDYAYNSVRVPWRLGTAWVATSDPRAKTAAARINTFIESATGGDPQNIVNGYKLDGTKIGEGLELLWEAPFGVSAMIDASNQAWLDKIWADISNVDDQGYFDTTVATLCVIVMSGNWWAP